MIDPPSVQPFKANIRDTGRRTWDVGAREVFAPANPFPVTFLAGIASHVGGEGQIREQTGVLQTVKLSRQPFRYVIEGDFRIRQR